MKIREWLEIALMLAMLIVCSQLTIPLGPVPLTLQTLAVMVIGYSLSSRQVLLVFTMYLVMGLLGLPVFANFSGGMQVFLSPSFGFALGFVPVAYLLAKLQERHPQASVRQMTCHGLVANVLLYGIGMAYMYVLLNYILNSPMSLWTVFTLACLPFIVGDLLKVMGAVLIARRIRQSSRRMSYESGR